MDYVLLCYTYNKARLVSVMQCAYGMGSSSILQKRVLHVLIIIIIIDGNGDSIEGGEGSDTATSKSRINTPLTTHSE